MAGIECRWVTDGDDGVLVKGVWMGSSAMHTHSSWRRFWPVCYVLRGCLGDGLLGMTAEWSSRKRSMLELPTESRSGCPRRE